MQSKAATVEAYLDTLPDDRRAALEAVRRVFRQNMDPQLAEVMNYGMIGYVVPHSVYPPGYHCDPKLPLPYAGLASQKGHMSLYLMGLYCGCAEDKGDDGLTPEARWFRDAWAKTGKKLDMGKACIRFKTIDALALDVLAESLRRMPVRTYVERYEEILGSSAGARTAAKGAKAAGAKPAAIKAKSGKASPAKAASAKAKPRAKANASVRSKNSGGKGRPTKGRPKKNSSR
jgi:hypothetical protein